MTPEQLQNASKKDLTDRARALGIAGYTSMRKEDLVRAITRAMKKKAKEREKAKAAKAQAASSAPAPSLNGRYHGNGKPAAPAVPVAKKGKPEVKKAEPAVPAQPVLGKPPRNLQGGSSKDRIVVVVRDPYWLHAFWELTHQSVQRAEAALGQDWHGARPILRVFDVSSQDTTSTAEAIVRDVEIHGGCNNWYVEVNQPPRSYRVDVGYVSRRGQFYVLARSNVVTTPKAGVSDTIDENWSDVDAKQADRLYAMSSGFDPTAGDTRALREFFEERLRRPMNAPALANSVPPPPGKERKFFFSIDAEMIVFGRTQAGARVTIQGEPVKLRPDGTFTMRYSFPDGRQILPAIAESADGVEERKIVLAVERNTKELEPLIHDTNEGT
ncbi:MAG TPA: DUF4912 domain-containing protein [Gemmataceae bacterium]|nr:DUF4912 domain-containing protein [Gemmataceae bacterium]